MNKLMNTAKKLDTFFKIFQKIMKTTLIVVLCVLGVLTIANFVNSDAVIANGFYSVNIGPITIKLAEGYSPEDNNMLLTYMWLGMGAVTIVVLALNYAFEQIRKILKPMSEGNPFDSTVSVNIRKVAYVSIVLGIVANVASFIETFVAIKMIDRFNLLENVKEGTIQSVTTNFSMDLTFLVVFFVLLLMSYIFHYGEELQQQVDETL